MGADMIVSTLWISQGADPDWTAAKTAAEDLTCPPDGFPETSPLSDTILEDRILTDYTDQMTDQQRKEVVDSIIEPALEQIQDGVDGKRRDMTLSVFAGWQVYITGGLSWGDAPTDLTDSIDTLRETGILQAAGFFQKPKSVVAVILESDYGHTIHLVADKQAAERTVAEFCREFWDTVMDDPNHPDPPEDDHETIERFFANAPANWSETRKEVSTENVAI